MKRFTQIICLLLAAATFLAIPVFAESRASNYFMKYSTYLYKISDTQFEIWFDVTAVGGMEELGVKTIELEWSTDKSNWSPVKTYSKEDYSQMIKKNTSRHADCVPYTYDSGYYYRAYVTFYAKNSSGRAEYSDYTATLDLRK